jgi:hypothetical protein
VNLLAVGGAAPSAASPSHSPAAIAPAGAVLRASLAPEARVPDVPLGTCTPGEGASGEWQYLSDLNWVEAANGWQALADKVIPERDAAFSRNPIVLQGQAYGKGLGTYPVSEITYELGGRYGTFAALAGINDDAPPDARAVFLVYADGVLVHNTGTVSVQSPPAPIEVCVAGVQRVTLVTTAPGGAGPANGWPSVASSAPAVWAAARLFAPGTLDLSAASAVQEQLAGTRAAQRARVIGEMGVYQAAAQLSLAAARQAVGLPADAPPPAETRGVLDGAGNAVLLNNRLAVSVGVGGPSHAQLAVTDVLSGAPLVRGATSALGFAGGALDLTGATVPDGDEPATFERLSDPVLGSGTVLRLRVRSATAQDARAVLEVALYDGTPSLTYRIVLDGAWGQPLTAVQYLGAGDETLILGDNAGGVADATQLHLLHLGGDGLWRSSRVGLGKPAVLWGNGLPSASASGSGSAIFAILDEQRYPAWLVTRRDQGHAATVAGIAQPMSDPDSSPEPSDSGRFPVAGPRLLVEFARTADLRTALTHYRQVSTTLYPPAPVPPWVRYQWGSWWTYGSAVNETGLRRQIDTIAERLGDLGPWHIILDAGWQDVGPGGSGDLGRTMPDKFPNGLRGLIDYAHARGVRVLLFYSAVYAHDGSAKGEWLGLPGWVSGHAGWFQPLTPAGVRPARYLFDYGSEATHRYLADTLRRYVTEYDADGVKIDGLGDVEGQLIPFWERTTIRPHRWATTPVMDVYRTVSDSVRGEKPDAFIESGWADPATAAPFAHSFRYGDERDAFSSSYPFPGLAEHFTYAALQRGVLGQRPNAGAVYGGLERPLAHQWLGAALALGAHVSLGSDLRVLSPPDLARLRALLVNYRPFEGTTVTGGDEHGLAPVWSATTMAAGDLTFVGVLNREAVAQRVRIDLAEAAVPSPAGDHITFDALGGAVFHAAGALTVEVPANSFRLYVLRATPGVIWTDSSYKSEPVEAGLHLHVRGPDTFRSQLLIYVPSGAKPAVLLDGKPLEPLLATAPEDTEGFAYDAATGLLTIRFYNFGPSATDQFPSRTLEVRWQ